MDIIGLRTGQHNLNYPGPGDKVRPKYSGLAERKWSACLPVDTQECYELEDSLNRLEFHCEDLFAQDHKCECNRPLIHK